MYKSSSSGLLRAKSDGAALTSSTQIPGSSSASSSSGQGKDQSPSPNYSTNNNRMRKNTPKGNNAPQQRTLSTYVSRFFMVCLILLIPTFQYLSIGSSAGASDNQGKGLRGGIDSDSSHTADNMSGSNENTSSSSRTKGVPTAPKIPTIPNHPQQQQLQKVQQKQQPPPPNSLQQPEEYWTPVVDKDTGKIYWWNKATGETTKVMPKSPYTHMYLPSPVKLKYMYVYHHYYNYRMIVSIYFF